MRNIHLALLLILAVSGICAERIHVPDELAAYIRDSKKMGLPDEQVRRNMAAAGWNTKVVDAAFSAYAAARQSAALTSSAVGEGYLIGIGDVLQVSVWREPDASAPTATVRSDGKISLPLVKDVEVAGMTAAEVERTIAERMSKFIRAPEVTVIVREIHSQKVYLIGAVRTVGPVTLTGPMTVLQAITEAGGLTDYAKKKQIYILRTVDGKQTRLPFNYEAVINGQGIAQNVQLLPNDTIVVPD